ncbi:hypothetical protein MPSEU_000273200 [Mayamaea pseudoterrestris]|nr:hypothetical protein MPSEU_000273200 [Mayamaea pseudoterrestris]
MDSAVVETPETTRSHDEAPLLSTETFRTVLPHEPLPSDDGPGYLHVQGSFQPKITGAAVMDIVGKRKDADDSEASNQQSQESSFWTRESLQQALGDYFMQQSASNSLFKALAVAAVKVHVLDPLPPFTKIRLEYSSTSHAFRAMLELKGMEIVPADIFASLLLTEKARAFADPADRLAFSSKPLQVNLITQQPLVLPSWSRSTPPKLRRLIARSGEDKTLLQRQREETRFVFISNLFQDNILPQKVQQSRFILADAIRSVVNVYDSSKRGAEVFVPSSGSGKNRNITSCHAGMRSAEDAQALIHSLQGQRVSWKLHLAGANEATDGSATVDEYPSGALFLDYVAIQWRSKDLPRRETTRPDCTSTTAHVVVPGLMVVRDFITEAQEAALMATVAGPHAPWAPSQTTSSANGTLKRRVQHYGYVFDYKTADVLRNRDEPGADCPAMPAMLNLTTNSKQHLEEESQRNISSTDLSLYLDFRTVMTALSKRLTRFWGAVKRRVCHYFGYCKDQTNVHVDLDAYLDECVIAGEGWGLLAGVTERVRRYNFGKYESDDAPRIYSTLNQLTVNEYRPGEGIGSHVDTPSAFGDGLLSLSLNSGITMEFRKVNSANGQDRKKLVYLPRRSIVLMSGPARYEWEHMIVTRATDVDEGTVHPRGVRVSLTFRTALDQNGAPLPLVQSNSFPPTWGDDYRTVDPLRTPACERDHVHAVYDAIATQWHHTRGRRGVLWPGATRFLQELEPGSLVADVGCGDGKYFPAIWQGGSYVIGTDISTPLLKTAFLSDQHETRIPESRRMNDERRHLHNQPAVCAADCMNLPLQSKRFDAAICIAVLHHLSTKDRRRRCIEELIRIVKPGGLINIQAWARTQEEESRRKFAASDLFVPFNAQPKYLKAAVGVSDETRQDLNHKSTAQVCSEALNAEFDDCKGLVVFQRYCHMYKEGELDELLDNMPHVELVESGFEAGNYYIILRVV